jgi:hypothetical protein
MLIGISKAIRLRFALALVAMYAVCVLAPSVAVAFNGAPCLNETAGMMQLHTHADAASHDHAAPHHHEDGSDHQKNSHKAGEGNCCGAMFFSAIAPSFELSLVPAVLNASIVAGIVESFDGLAPYKLIRPPKSLS